LVHPVPKAVEVSSERFCGPAPPDVLFRSSFPRRAEFDPRNYLLIGYQAPTSFQGVTHPHDYCLSDADNFHPSRSIQRQIFNGVKISLNSRNK